MTSPRDPQANEYIHIRGTRDDLLDRLTVSELCKGWPVYRDASEWKNYRSLFAEDAYVWTTWSKRLHIDDFIAASKKGKSAGDFIMHRELGTLVDLNPSTGRAVGKMKATITQRFVNPAGMPYVSSLHAGGPVKNQNQKQAEKIDGDEDEDMGNTVASSPGSITDGNNSNCQKSTDETPVEYDVDCDCQFHFFCHKTANASSSRSTGGEWKVKYVKLIYAKDKVVPIDGYRVPVFSADELAPYPQGYKYLGAAQARLGHDMDLQLPTPGDHVRWLDLYDKMAQWLDGEEDVDLVGRGPSSAADGKTAVPASGKKTTNGVANGVTTAAGGEA